MINSTAPQFSSQNPIIDMHKDTQKQDKSSDIEQQPPFGDRK